MLGAPIVVGWTVPAATGVGTGIPAGAVIVFCAGRAAPRTLGAGTDEIPATVVVARAPFPLIVGAPTSATAATLAGLTAVPAGVLIAGVGMTVSAVSESP